MNGPGEPMAISALMREQVQDMRGKAACARRTHADIKRRITEFEEEAEQLLALAYNLDAAAQTMEDRLFSAKNGG